MCAVYCAIAICNYKAAQYKKEINKQIAVIYKIIIDEERIGKCAHVIENNHGREYTTKDIEYFKPFFHRILDLIVNIYNPVSRKNRLKNFKQLNCLI